MAVNTASRAETGEVVRHKITLEEFEHMVSAGVFQEDARLELIEGVLVDMTPVGFDHGFGVANLIRVIGKLAGESALVWVQSPIRLPDNTRPEPDFALLKPRPDLSPGSPPTAADVLLVVEVSDTSLNYDRKVKAPLYAAALIPEYWIVNLHERTIEVYTNPAEGAYKQTRTVGTGDPLRLPAPLEGTMHVSDILPSQATN